MKKNYLLIAIVVILLGVLFVGWRIKVRRSRRFNRLTKKDSAFSKMIQSREKPPIETKEDLEAEIETTLGEIDQIMKGIDLEGDFSDSSLDI